MPKNFEYGTNRTSSVLEGSVNTGNLYHYLVQSCFIGLKWAQTVLQVIINITSKAQANKRQTYMFYIQKIQITIVDSPVVASCRMFIVLMVLFPPKIY